MQTQTRTIRSAVITGPTGAIGRALCSLLAAKGVTVYAVCRPGSPRAAALPQSEWVHPVVCDMAALDTLKTLLPGGADAFFHFAWAHTIGPGRDDMPAQIENIRCTLAAVDAAAALGCQVFVGSGSQAEYGRVEGKLRPDTPCSPENGYGMAKLCAGQMSRVACQKQGIAHVWARVLSVYGPGDGAATMISSAIRALLEKKVPALTKGEQRWDYLYAGDAARAFWAMAARGKDGAVYPVGSGQARPLREYIETLRDAIDPALPLGFGQVPYGPRQVMHLEADLCALTADTGFVPETPFAEGIRKTIESMQEKTV
ncbi:MAG: NAD(P)-dependent oxidoreductase [Faecalibacterium sp.]|nr:NAD(P)-dependent oxidoreductase [Faecalibacterium sp.]